MVAVASYYCPYCGATLNVAFAANNGASDRQLLTTTIVSFGSAYLGSEGSGFSKPVSIFGTAALQIGGVLAAGGGGNRGHAILAAAFSSVAQFAIYSAGLGTTSAFIAQTLTSGTAAYIGDGKFANGALSVMESWAIRSAGEALYGAMQEAANEDAARFEEPRTARGSARSAAGNGSEKRNYWLKNRDRVDAIAKLALRAAVDKQSAEGVEYGGLIYVASDGLLHATPLVGGEFEKVQVFAARQYVPDGAEIVADFHTHPLYDYFSQKDILLTNEYGTFTLIEPSYIGSYLAGPSGNAYFYQTRSWLNDSGTAEDMMEHQDSIGGF